jgi:hypothetical protein
MAEFRKIPTEYEIIDQLRQGKVLFPPLSIRFLEEKPIIDGEKQFDAAIDIFWHDQPARFAVECKSPPTPKVFHDGLNRLKFSKFDTGYHPLLLMPYLREQHLLD